MAKSDTPIEYDKYRVSVRRDGHVSCQICGKPIFVGNVYYDGGEGRRAHVTCAKQARFDEYNANPHAEEA